MTARKEYFYQSLGHELMKELAAALVGSELTPGGEPGAYQTLNLSNGMHVRFTQWRGGEGPFYIILFRGARYLFELDLSMIVHHDDHYTWNLKIPSHETNRNFLQAWLGAPERFDGNYSHQVGIVKESISSGVNTPRTGHLFLENIEWPKLCERYCELMRRAIQAHATADEEVPSIIEAGNDDGSKVAVNRKVRRHQSQFRLNILNLYNGKCAISGESVLEVLEAAHIENHATSGINHTGNGLLLRSDLHRLFDANKITIHPKSLKIGISSTLKKSTYKSFAGLTLRPRDDGTHPDKEYLDLKWDSAKKSN